MQSLQTLGNYSLNREGLCEAAGKRSGSVGPPVSTASKAASVALDVKYPDALNQFALTLEVSPEKIATVGDVWALTSQSLNRTTKALEDFASEPTPDKYTALRVSIEN